jgi:hypothetical protein
MTRHETGPSAVALGVALTLTWSVLDTLGSPRLGTLLGVGFVLTCLWLAATIGPGHFFTVGVLPPLLLTGVLLLTALLHPVALEGGSVLDRVVGGLVDQRLWLVLAWAGTLAVLATRSARSRRPRAAAPREHRPTSPPPSSAPPGSPLPR